MAQTSTAKTSSKPIRPLLVLLLGAAAYGGYSLYQSRRPYEWSGTVEAHVTTVGSRTGGRVKEVRAREGETVHGGDILVVLEPGDLGAQRLAAEGALLQADANLQKLRAGARPEEIAQVRARAATASAALQQFRAGARSEQLAAASSRLAAAQVSVDKAQRDLERSKELFRSGAVSSAEADAVESGMRGAVAQRDALQHVYEELQNGVRREELAQADARAQEAFASAKLVESGARIEDIRAAEGARMAAEGKLQAIETLLKELEIKAPTTARVETLSLRPGDLLAPNAPAATLLELDELYVRIYVPETRIGLLHVGTEVPITVDSFPGRSFRGRIDHINDVGEFSPRNIQTADERANQVFATRIHLVDGQHDLRAGMAAFLMVPKP